MTKVAIILSTYNGEKFIKEQLDSILNQTYKDFDLIIRDDGSSDKTKEIIQRFAKICERVEIILGENYGAARSYIELLSIASKEYKYYAFADQDDYWLEDKLFVAIDKIKNDENVPCLYHSRQILVDKNRNYLKISGHYIERGYTAFPCDNNVTGCTVVFNNCLMRQLKKYKPQKVIMHDGWVKDVALLTGGRIIFDETPHIEYRQHENNCVGAKKDLFSSAKRKIKHVKKNKGNYLAVWQGLLEGYYSEMNEENHDMLRRLVQYQKSIGNKLAIIFSPKIMKGRFSKNAMVSVLFLFNMM